MNVRFAPVSLIELQIKHPMKTAPSLSQTPFADLMLHPEKLEAVLETVKNKNGASTAPRTIPPTGISRNNQKQPQQNNMKTKIPPWAAITAMAVLILAGCERHAENNMPAATNAADNQPSPGVTVSNNVIVPPPATWNDTNLPAFTNWPGTNNPTATNQ